MEVRGQQQMSSSGVLSAPYLVRKGILLILSSLFLLDGSLFLHPSSHCWGYGETEPGSPHHRLPEPGSPITLSSAGFEWVLVM